MERGIKSFRDLDVYKKAYDASLEIHKFTLTLPTNEQYALADQLRRTSKSICANIAEGFVKQRASKAEFKRFLLIAIGSASEMLVWIDYCRDLNYSSITQFNDWSEKYESIHKMLHAFYGRV